MDPPSTQHLATLISPAGSRVNLPGLLASAGSGSGATTAEGIFSSLASPPLSGPPTGSDGSSSRAGDAGQRREVFSDLRRFVTFGLRRDTAPP